MEMMIILGIVALICVVMSWLKYGWVKTAMSVFIGTPIGSGVLGGLGYLLVVAVVETGSCTGMGCFGWIIAPIAGAIVGSFVGFFTVLWFLVKRDKRKRKNDHLIVG